MDLGLKILSILATAWMTLYFAIACEMLRAAYTLVRAVYSGHAPGPDLQ